VTVQPFDFRPDDVEKVHIGQKMKGQVVIMQKHGRKQAPNLSGADKFIQL